MLKDPRGVLRKSFFVEPPVRDWAKIAVVMKMVHESVYYVVDRVTVVKLKWFSYDDSVKSIRIVMTNAAEQ